VVVVQRSTWIFYLFWLAVLHTLLIKMEVAPCLPGLSSSSSSGVEFMDVVDQVFNGAKKRIVPPAPPSVYFGGCCFGAAFYVGVYQAMVELWGPDFHKNMIISGGSAGTVFAVGIALGKNPDELNEMYKLVAQQSHEHGPFGTSSIFTERAIRQYFLKDPVAYKKVEGKCCFGTTAFFSKHRWHVSWESNEDLMTSMEASYNIPFYCQKIEALRGDIVLDGAYGFAGTDLPHGDETLYIGIDPHAEITRTFTNAEMVSIVYM
jgi:hypothetical protein